MAPLADTQRELRLLRRFVGWQQASARWLAVAYMKVALWKGNLDAGIVQQAHRLQSDFAGDLHAIVFLHHPKMQLEVQGTLPKPLEVNHRFRLDEHQLVAGGSFTKELQHDSRVSAIGHSYW